MMGSESLISPFVLSATRNVKLRAAVKGIKELTTIID